MYRLFRPLLFVLPPERAHHLVFRLLALSLRIPGLGRWLRSYYQVQDPSLVREVLGLRFANPVGLAAGFDKDARLLAHWGVFGFGFVEIGTVTPRPQVGNPQPRLFRLPDDQALINRMGFNNGGMEAVRARLLHRPADLIVGGNIGKNKDTPNERAADDYIACIDALYDVVDYFVVNVSSPNTPGLRALQEKGPLTALLLRIQQHNATKPVVRPVLLKIAPDLTDGQLDDIIDIVHQARLAGIIATNTTIRRDGLRSPADLLDAIGAGGLSGSPLRARATEVIRYLRQKAHPAVVIIGVGGIFSPADAAEKLAAGANLVQLYTGFVYEGPGLVRSILRRLASRA